MWEHLANCKRDISGLLFVCSSGKSHISANFDHLISSRQWLSVSMHRSRSRLKNVLLSDLTEIVYLLFSCNAIQSGTCFRASSAAPFIHIKFTFFYLAYPLQVSCMHGQLLPPSPVYVLSLAGTCRDGQTLLNFGWARQNLGLEESAIVLTRKNVPKHAQKTLDHLDTSYSSRLRAFCVRAFCEWEIFQICSLIHYADTYKSHYADRQVTCRLVFVPRTHPFCHGPAP